ncbi:putative exported protein [Enhygromyxa salina]|uniref:Putative exported protein n=1 Tax=Enhygromyxa salina TaxID=215803 RepID=A0A0C1Z5E8_9BACT|nr:DUF2169 domain-containing protein [Enhygromyxa salina]KIG12824.1 putative exported protein [Enhygromyxa salina]
MSVFVALENHTPFMADEFVLPDGNGQEVLLIVLKASFEIAPNGLATLAPVQRELVLADEHRGEPGASSVVRDHDLALAKPFVDVLVEGSAHAPGGRPAGRVIVELGLGSLHKRVAVHGERSWMALEPGRPAPFMSLPLTWERAFGGEQDVRNPVGVGMGADPRVPNIEDPRHPLVHRGQRPPPVGLGVVARSWQPRAKWAGTYDDAWLGRRWPLLPDDYHALHDQAAPEDQRLEQLIGNEQGVIVNMRPGGGPWHFRVPRLDVPVHLLYRDRSEQTQLRVDTLELLPEARELILTARLLMPLPRNCVPLVQIDVGHLTPGCLRARASSKRHVDLRGLGGADLSRPCFAP